MIGDQGILSRFPWGCIDDDLRMDGGSWLDEQKLNED